MLPCAISDELERLCARHRQLKMPEAVHNFTPLSFYAHSHFCVRNKSSDMMRKCCGDTEISLEWLSHDENQTGSLIIRIWARTIIFAVVTFLIRFACESTKDELQEKKEKNNDPTTLR